MKKFLDLKKSIIDSKNQPTLMQTYLDSIRSSCYKLASPQATPRGKQNISGNIGDSTSSKKKNVYKCNLSDLMSESSPTSSHKSKSLEEHSQLEQIFSRLSSSCKPIQPTEQEILRSILQNLDQLPKRKQYEQSIQLIRKIISVLPHAGFNVSAEIEDSCLKNGYTLTAHDISLGANDSHLKSHIHLEEDEGKIDTSSRSMSNKINMKIDWSKEQFKNQSPLKSTKIKYQVHPHNASIQASQDSIQISDSKSNSSPSNSDLDYTMRSQDLNNWKQKSLSCISELDQNQQSNEDDSRMKKCSLQVPQETIEFKKIIYMLDSGSTYKKSQQKVLLENSRSSGKKIFSNQNYSVSRQTISLHNSSQDIPSMSTKKPQHSHTLSDPHLLRVHNRSSSSWGKNSGVRKQEQKCVSEFNGLKSDKRKGLKQIVDMLSNKYNRTAKLHKNFI